MTPATLRCRPRSPLLAALTAAAAAIGCAGGAAGGGPDGGAPPPPPLDADCTAGGPTLPVAATFLRGPPASEDFTFDAEGYLLALEGGHSVMRAARAARATLVQPNVVVNGRGFRVLAGGDLAIADQDRSLIVRVDPGGGIRRLSTAVARPNGVEVGPGGALYVTNFGAGGEVYRIDADSGAAEVVAQPGDGANGLAFSLDRRTLYIGDHDTGVVHRLPLLADGRPAGALEPWARGLVKPDGMATDECGQVYAASWDRKVYRISPGGEVQVLAELPAVVSAVRFGSGKQGWDARTLYAMALQEGGLYEIPVGRRAAPAP